jgi:hypothetical protein
MAENNKIGGALSKRAKVFIGGVVGFIGLLASIEQLFPGTVTNQFKAIYLTLTQPYIGFALNIMLLIISVSLLWLAYTQKNERTKLKEIINLDKGLLDDLVKRLITITLNSHTTPSPKDAVTEASSQMIKRTHLEKADLRVSIAMPCKGGRFKIIWWHNIEDERIKQLEEIANWQNNETFFALGFLSKKKFMREDSENDIVDEGKDVYFAGKPTADYKRSEVHFIIPLKSTLYYKEFNKEGCLAVVAISSPDPSLIPEDKSKQMELYTSIYNPLKAMEIVLQQYQKSFSENGTYPI